MGRNRTKSMCRIVGMDYIIVIDAFNKLYVVSSSENIALREHIYTNAEKPFVWDFPVIKKYFLNEFVVYILAKGII